MAACLFELAVDDAYGYLAVLGVVVATYQTSACHRHVVAYAYQFRRTARGVVANADRYQYHLVPIGGCAVGLVGEVLYQTSDIVECVRIGRTAVRCEIRCLVVGSAVVLEESLHIALGQHEQRFRSTEGVLAVLSVVDSPQHYLCRIDGGVLMTVHFSAYGLFLLYNLRYGQGQFCVDACWRLDVGA